MSKTWEIHWICRNCGYWYMSVEYPDLPPCTWCGNTKFIIKKSIVGDALAWLIKIKGYTFSEARRILSEYKDFTDTYVYTIKGEGELQDVIAYPKLIDIFWEEGLKNRQYWYNRLLNDDTINRFRLGYHDGWYTIPF